MPSKIILPPFLIKIGLMNNFTKALDIGGKAILFLKSKFPYKIEAKLKAWIFDGQQIRELIRDRSFEIIMAPDQRDAWNAFKYIVENFLGNQRSHDFEVRVEYLMRLYHDIGDRMSIKMDCLNSHLDYFLTIVEITVSSKENASIII